MPYHPGLRGGLGLFGVARDLVLPLEAVDTAGGIHQLLLAREERVAGGADFHADVAFVRRLSLERVAAGANHVHRSISGMNSSFHFCGGDPFETFSIAKLETPVAVSGTTGVASLGENLRLWLRKRQPVHRNLTPPTGSGRRLR